MKTDRWWNRKWKKNPNQFRRKDALSGLDELADALDLEVETSASYQSGIVRLEGKISECGAMLRMARDEIEELKTARRMDAEHVGKMKGAFGATLAAIQATALNAREGM